MKRLIGAVFVGVGVFVAVIACSIGGLAIAGNVANEWQSGRQQVEVTQAQAEIAKEERLQVEAQQAPELIEEQWQGATTHLLAVATTERDKELTRAMIRLALADLNEREQWRGFSQGAWMIVLLFLVGVIWWLAASRAVDQ